MKTAFRPVAAVVVVWFVMMGVAAGSESEKTLPSLDQVLARFDEVQGSVRTLSAHFTETSVNRLLKEPVVSRGRFYMTKPDSVMWKYTSPESMQFVIAQNEYVGYFPGRKRAERRDIHRWREQIFRFFGLGQVSTELEQFYDIRMEEPGPDMKGTYLLVLDPKKRRVKKRMKTVYFWLDDASYLPVKVEYRDKSGNTRVIRFQKMQINPDLSAGLYRLEIPSDVTVTTGFEGLQGLGSTQ